MPTLFEPDSEKTNSAKNMKLASLLGATWNLLNITRIDRIETPQQGWQVTYRE